MSSNTRQLADSIQSIVKLAGTYSNGYWLSPQTFPYVTVGIGGAYAAPVFTMRAPDSGPAASYAARLQANTGGIARVQVVNADITVPYGDITFTADGRQSWTGVFSAPSLIISSSFTPASASAPGIVGQQAWDANYYYVCVATNSWKRTPLTSW